MTDPRASGSGSSSPPQWKYNVFLSFRGDDTRKNFTGHLYDKLLWRGIRTFKDNPELERGASISPELFRAIEESRFAVVVLSPNYASSSWCLDELSKIFYCMEARNTILPVFYDVDSSCLRSLCPNTSHVRKQMGTFTEAFDRHEENFQEDSAKVRHWRVVLTKLGNLAGWASKDSFLFLSCGYETELTNEIVETVWNKVRPTFTLSSREKFVEIDSKIEQLDMLLDVEANDVLAVGIWGIGGIGKTTIGRLLYERISHRFEVCTFLANVREVSAKHGIVNLQKQLLSPILKEKFTQVSGYYGGSMMIKNCLWNKKVLLVLDDVDQLEQLELLVGDKRWFGAGSRIIITTRDLRLLVSR
ncbi:unnamed protein product [Malus baccata var. baccata]